MADTVEEFWFPVNIPFGERVGWNTLVTRYEDGKEQRRKKWSVPKRLFTIVLRGRTDTVMGQVWDFYNSRSGAFDTFYFENKNESPIANEYLGSGDNSSTIYNLDNYPIPSGSPTSLTVDDVVQSEGADYTIVRSTGVITFLSAPASGDIYADYAFCRKVRFAENNLTREMFNYKLYNADFGLLQVF